jgi:hypothetical protein
MFMSGVNREELNNIAAIIYNSFDAEFQIPAFFRKN